MIGDSDHSQLPTGIDLGNAMTVGAVVDETGARLLQIGDDTAIPTRLGISADGFVIGSGVTTTDAEEMNLRVLPTGDGGTAESTTGALPLTTFLRELDASWEAGAVDTIDSLDFDYMDTKMMSESKSGFSESSDVADSPNVGGELSNDAEADSSVKTTHTDTDEISTGDGNTGDSSSAGSDESVSTGETETDNASTDRRWTRVTDKESNDDDSMSTDGGTPSGDSRSAVYQPDAGVKRSAGDGTDNGATYNDGDTSDPGTNEVPSVSTKDTDGLGTVMPRTTTMTVPGTAAAEDIARLETAAAAAGFDDVRAVRNPVAVAATELPETVEERTVLIADVGTEGASFALVTISEGTLDVEARSTLVNEGRRTLDDTLARFVLNEIGKEHDATIEFDEAAMDTVRGAAHEVLDEIGPTTQTDDVANIDIELIDGVEVVDGGWFGEDKLTVNLDVSITDCYEALADHLRAMQEAITDLMEATDRSTNAVNDLLLAGDGTRPVAVTHAIEKVADQESRVPKYGGRYHAGAIGAAILSAERAQESSPVDTETYDRVAEVRALDESGPTYRPITTVASGPGTECQVQLTQADDDQLAGIFELWYRHRQTGERARAGTVVCSNLPAKSESTLTVTFEHDNPELDETVNPLDVVDITVSADTDMSSSVDVSVTEDCDLPWLGFVGADIASVDNERSAVEEQAYIDARSTQERVINDIDDEGVIESAYTLRNKLWERAVKQETGLERDELEMLLSEFDEELGRFGAEIINPAIGSIVEGSRHRVIETRPSEHDKGTILEVKQPGLIVDDIVIESAVVIASE